MYDASLLAPPGWPEALAESEAELAAGRTVPSEPITQRLRETIARHEAKRAVPADRPDRDLATRIRTFRAGKTLGGLNPGELIREGRR